MICHPLLVDRLAKIYLLYRDMCHVIGNENFTC